MPSTGTIVSPAGQHAVASQIIIEKIHCGDQDLQIQLLIIQDVCETLRRKQDEELREEVKKLDVYNLQLQEAIEQLKSFRILLISVLKHYQSMEEEIVSQEDEPDVSAILEQSDLSGIAQALEESEIIFKQGEEISDVRVKFEV